MDETPEFTPPQENVPMAARSPASPGARPPSRSVLGDVRSLLRFVYTHNPFYVISSVLIFAGLWRSFGKDPEMFEAGAMTLGLAAFTCCWPPPPCW